MTKKEKMYQAIEKHGENLNRIFKTKYDNITLSKKLFSLENKAHRLALDYCNGTYHGTDYDGETDEKVILDKVNALLVNIQKEHVPVFLNYDARGYALKIRSEYVQAHNLEIYKDWGGYGILAPDFNN
jgi:hypothetical protein